MRARSSLVFNAIAAIGVVAVLLTGRGEANAKAFELARASGALTLSNSSEGAAILHGDDLRPGARTSGTVTLGNPSGAATALALEVAPETETPGSGGGRLSERLQIAVSVGATTIYRGSPADMGRLTLGELTAGGNRTYAFEATLPAGPDDNAYQGARLSVRFTWLGQQDAVADPTTPPPPTTPPQTPPGPDPTSPPAPTAPAPAPAPAADPNASVRADQIMALPSAKSCLKRKTLALRVRAPQGVAVKSVKVTVNGRRGGSARSGKATITLRGLPRRKASLKVSIVLASGRTLALTRAYRTC